MPLASLVRPVVRFDACLIPLILLKNIFCVGCKSGRRTAVSGVIWRIAMGDPTAPPDASSPDTGQAFPSELETVLQRRAERLGIPIEELRTHDRMTLRASRAERLDCLDPYEVEQFFSGELAADRVEHAVQCAMCAALVDVSRPSDEGFNRLMRSLAKEAQLDVDVRPAWKSIPQVLKELTLIELGVVGVLAASFAALTVFGQGNITAMLIHATAPDSMRVTLIMALTTVLLALISAKWLAPMVPSLRWIDGRVVGGAFALFVVGYLAVTAFTLSAAQSTLVATIAKNATSGEIYADSVFTEYVPSLSGRLVAEKKPDSFHLYWEDADSRRTLGTAYLGRFARGANGVVKLRAAGRDIDLKQTTVVQSADVGQKAVVVVPFNATRATATTVGLVSSAR